MYKHLLFKDKRATRDYMRDKRAGTLNGRQWKDYQAQYEAFGQGFNDKSLPEGFDRELSNRYGVPVEGRPPGEYMARADKVINGVKDVLSDFGLESSLTSIYFGNSIENRRGDDGDAAMNGFGRLAISTNALVRGDNGSRAGYFASDTLRGLGTHEAGHAVARALSDKLMKNESNLARSAAWRLGKLESAVMKEAARRYGGNYRISPYGSTSAIEKVAEAVSDVYSNTNIFYLKTRELHVIICETSAQAL